MMVQIDFRRDLEPNGYELVSLTTCTKCDESIEIWHTPHKQELTLNLMMFETSPVVVHLLNCGDTHVR